MPWILILPLENAAWRIRVEWGCQHDEMMRRVRRDDMNLIEQEEQQRVVGIEDDDTRGRILTGVLLI